MALEENAVVPSNAHHSMKDEMQHSTDKSDVQANLQVESNILVRDNSDMELSRNTIQGVEEDLTTGSHEHQVAVAEHTKVRSSHTPALCKSSNHLNDVIVQATRSRPTCSVEPGMKHVDPGSEPVDKKPTLSSEFGGDDGTITEKDNENVTLSGTEEGVPGTEEKTAAQEEEEEVAQDEDILTFEEFKQRKIMEAQLHQQEGLKNSGNKSSDQILVCSVI